MLGASSRCVSSHLPACSIHAVFIDVTLSGTFSSLLMLSLITGINANGVSTSMNIVWHGGAPQYVYLTGLKGIR